MSSKKPITRGIKNPQYVICLQTVQVVAEVGFCGTWDLQKRKCSIGNTALIFVYLENFVSVGLRVSDAY